jgi:hypothetical protein
MSTKFMPRMGKSAKYRRAFLSLIFALESSEEAEEAAGGCRPEASWLDEEVGGQTGLAASGLTGASAEEDEAADGATFSRTVMMRRKKKGRGEGKGGLARMDLYLRENFGVGARQRGVGKAKEGR